MQNTEIDGFQLYTQENFLLGDFFEGNSGISRRHSKSWFKGWKSVKFTNWCAVRKSNDFKIFLETVDSSTPTCFAGSNDSSLFKPFVWLIQGLSQRKVIKEEYATGLI